MAIITAHTYPAPTTDPVASRAWMSAGMKGWTSALTDYDPQGVAIGDVLSWNPYGLLAGSYLPLSYTLVPGIGSTMPGTNAAIYNRFLITDGDNLLSDTPFTEEDVQSDTYLNYFLWNGWPTDEYVTNVAYSASEGVSLVAPIVTDRLRLFSAYALTVKIAAAHASKVFDVDITITTTNHTYVIGVTGTRFTDLSAFLSWANWQEPIKAVYRWATSIHTSVNNTEARKTLKDRPIRELDYTSLFSGELQVQQGWAMMQAFTDTQQYLPLIYDATFVTVDASAGYVDCDTTYRNFQVGYYAVLCHTNVFGSVGYGTDQPTVTYFPMRIGSITSSRLNFIGTLPETFEAGDVVFPAIYNEIMFKGVEHTIFGPDKGTLSMKLMEVYGSTTLPAANPSYSPTEFEGFADLEWAINWVKSPQMSVTRPAIVQKSGRYQVYDLLTDKSRATMKFLTAALTRAATWELRGKLTHMMGRYKAFWIKSPLDFLTVGAAQTSTEIAISTNVGDDNIVKIHGLYIENVAGQFEFITGNMVKNGSVWEFVYNNTATVASITIVRQAYLMRSSKDNFGMTWFSLDCADMEMDLIEVTEAYDV